MDRLTAADGAQIDAVVGLFRDILGDGLVGACLFGSAVTSGLRADSDLDILMVSSRRTTDSERRALIDGLLPLSRSRGDTSGKRHLEVTLVVLPDIRPWRYPPPMELQYGDWWRREFEAGDSHPWTSPNPDLAVLLAAARGGSVSLLGQPVADMIEPVPRVDLDRALRDVVPSLMSDLDDDTRNVLLTLSRVWYTLETGAIEAKDVAAEWASARLPGGGAALRRARAAYRGETADLWDDEAMAEACEDAAAMCAAVDLSS